MPRSRIKLEAKDYSGIFLGHYRSSRMTINPVGRAKRSVSPSFRRLTADEPVQAKRREQVSERIATKLRSEATLHHELAESEKELKTLRIATDSAEFVLKHKDAAASYPSWLSESS